jgi:aminomethyltransferase
VDLEVPDEVVGIAALRRIHAQGPARHQLGIVLAGAAPGAPHAVWYAITAHGRQVGA